MDKVAFLDLTDEIIRKSDDQKGFRVLAPPQAHLRLDDRQRRRVRACETRLDVSRATILVAMGANRLRRTTYP
jgi:hypothetical protein